MARDVPGPHGRRDRAPRRVAKAIVGAASALALASAALGLTAGSVSAECDGPIPDFRHVLTNARQVVIGDVVAVQPDPNEAPLVEGRSTRFTLQVRVVLRGSAPPVLVISDIPTQRCAVALMARVGDRVVLALDGTDFTPPAPANVAAWIRGEPPPWEGFDTITEGEIARLLGVDPAALEQGPVGPDALASTESVPPAGWPILAGIALALTIGIVALRRAARNVPPRIPPPRIPPPT